MGERMEKKAMDNRVRYDASDCKCNPLEQRSNWNRCDQAQHNFQSAGQKIWIECGSSQASIVLVLTIIYKIR